MSIFRVTVHVKKSFQASAGHGTWTSVHQWEPPSSLLLSERAAGSALKKLVYCVGDVPVEELRGKLAIKPAVTDALCEYDLQHAVSGGGAIGWRHS